MAKKTNFTMLLKIRFVYKLENEAEYTELPNFEWRLEPALLPDKHDVIQHQGNQYQVVNRCYYSGNQGITRIDVHLTKF